MRRPRLAAALGAVALILAGLWTFREGLALTFLGAQVEKRTIEEQAAFIAPSVHAFAPSVGDGQFPTIIMFHGCAGYRPDFIRMWADIANEAGFLALAVDSGAPRGFDREAMLAKVCGGKALIGQERAGDVAAAYAIARARKDVDPDRIVFAGWSHGAWTLMDYLSFAGAGRLPPSIKGEGSLEDPAGVILFYPYCGEGAWSRLLRWRTKAEMIAFIAGSDSIVDADECRRRLEKIDRAGTPIDIVDYPDADHAFDDRTNIGGAYEYLYSAEANADAQARVAAFLEKIAARD